MPPAAATLDESALREALIGVDAVVVLGKELRRDPARALRELRARSAAAAVALRLGVPLAVSLEAPLRGQVDAGSALVARILAELGVPAERLVRQERTRSTREEAVESGRLARARGWRRLLVVTAAYHQPRAQAYFEALPGLSVRVWAPERLQAAATATEAAWIDAGQPDPRAVAFEARTERTFSALGWVLRPLPRALGWRIEILAGAALRGATRSRERGERRG